VVRPAGARNGAASERSEHAARKKPARRTELIAQPRPSSEAMAIAAEPNVMIPNGPATVEPEKEEVDIVGESQPEQSLLPTLETIALAALEETVPESPASSESQEVPEDDDRPEALEPRRKRKQRSEQSPSMLRTDKVEEEGQSILAPIAPTLARVTCGNCSRETNPLPVSEGRGRCEHCKSVFPLGAIPRPTVRKKEAIRPFLTTWRKPLTIGGAVAAALLVLVLVGPQLFGNGRVRVYRAHGKADFEGKPMSRATVILHPVNAGSSHFPLPCATVREDGTFAIGTYGKGDGAPAGEYKVTVQWVIPVGGNPVPMNVLPAKYSDAQSSDLTVRIKSGSNTLPPLQFTRAGKK
jgi:hypothetical protein